METVSKVTFYIISGVFNLLNEPNTNTRKKKYFGDFSVQILDVKIFFKNFFSFLNLVEKNVKDFRKKKKKKKNGNLFTIFD